MYCILYYRRAIAAAAGDLPGVCSSVSVDLRARSRNVSCRKQNNCLEMQNTYIASIVPQVQLCDIKVTQSCFIQL